MKYQYSVTQWIYGNEDIEQSMIRLKKYGYSGMEFAAEPYSLDVDLLKTLLDKFDLKCSSLCGIYNIERDLSSSDAKIRSNAIRYVKDSINMAKELQASTLIVVPSPVGKVSPDETYTQSWKYGVQSLKEIAPYAQEQGVYLAIEAINRYETFLLYNLTLALNFVEEVNHPNVGLMADLFHMSLEERNSVSTLKNIQKYLKHIHIADNTREAAGLGNTNFVDVFKTLEDINYKGWITMEFMPAISDPYVLSSQEQNKDVMEEFTKQSINYCKQLTEKI